MKVAVLMGGKSAEHDVSMRSGQQVLEACEGAIPVVIQKDGQFIIDERPQPSMGAALDWLASNIDVVFIALHGPYGEDGTVQGLLESFGIAYTGSGIAASALAMDKARAKMVYKTAKLPTPDFELLSPYQSPKDAELCALADRIGLPCAVKVTCNGSSFGVSFPKNKDDFVRDIRAHLQASNEVVVERFVGGRELTCGVLELPGEGAVALPITEIIPGEGYEFFDYEAKYKPGATAEITPADISEDLAKEVKALALSAHYALGCRDFSRTDFLLDEGRPVILETNTIPGLTRESLLPQEAAAHGIEFAKMVDILVRAAALRS